MKLTKYETEEIVAKVIRELESRGLDCANIGGKSVEEIADAIFLDWPNLAERADARP
jgi:hypothetical protein